jgi:hypothetical protein
VVVALPFYALGYAGLGMLGMERGSRAAWMMLSWFAAAGSLAFPSAVAVGFLFIWLRHSVSERVAGTTALAMFFGTMWSPYCTVLFSHALTIALVAIAQTLLVPLGDSNGPGASSGYWGDYVGGFCAGLALASEYTAGLVVCALLAWKVTTRPRSVWRLMTGALPAMVLVPVYSWICFGTPLLLPYSAQASFPEMHVGLYGIAWPNAAVAAKLLFSPARGLLFWSPFLALVAAGWWVLFRKRPSLLWLMLVLPVVQWIVIAGREFDWEAGVSFGPRYLAPVIPLLALPCALGFVRFPRLGGGLIFCSVAFTSAATVTGMATYGVENPLCSIVVPALRVGRFSPSMISVMGGPRWAGVALFCALLIGGFACVWLPRRVRRNDMGSGKTREWGR